MLMVNAAGMSERQRQMDNGRLDGQEENLEALLHLLWTIREMDAYRDYSMADYFGRLRKRGGDGLKMEAYTAPKVLTLLENWAYEIRAFLVPAGDAGEPNS